jgi:hypothetical protein
MIHTLGHVAITGDNNAYDRIEPIQESYSTAPTAGN